MAEAFVEIERADELSALFGEMDSNVRSIEERYGVKIITRGGLVRILGSDAACADAKKAVENMIKYIAAGEQLDARAVGYIASVVDEGAEEELPAITDSDCVLITTKGKPIKAKTIGQHKYVKAIKENTITIGVGPAGTGKTYLAVAQAVAAFRAKEVSRIILTRPAVEAGEKLGFLPGDLQQKIDPYLRPLYDALFDMMGSENFARCHERGEIEVAPLAYMRGRTLDESFVILDEAQNTTCEQMKMFLTRLGFGSKIVVTGDITQIDLPDGKKSGLKEAVGVLKNIKDIAIVRLNDKDVVRHKLVQDIIKAYEKGAASK
ncbi:MAG: PhoH family protein [Clostridia bacterium]|nr:PhoH family protein [Clostridia bacterium]